MNSITGDAVPPPPIASQASSPHLAPLEPTSGATLFELETARRRGLRHRGALKTGAAEIDEDVLLGGFERGQVVGVSAEEGELGVLIGLHTVAHATVFGAARKATIITTLAPAAILPLLRDVITVQVQAKFGPAAGHRLQEVNGEVKRCLELISVSRVFDVEGLWEVISEIETPPSPTISPVVAADEEEGVGGGKEREDDVFPMDEVPTLQRSGSPRLYSQKPADALPKIPVLPSLRSPPQIERTERTEIGDSEEDEDEEISLSPSSPEKLPDTSPPQTSSSHPLIPPAPSPSPPAAPAVSSSAKASISTDKPEETSYIPDIILITHFSTLLTNLFTRSADNKTSAHTTLQHLSSHLRYLSRSAAGPLLMLLNTTSTSSSTSYSSATTSASTANAPNTLHSAASKKRPLEPTLRSIFSGGKGEGEGRGGGNARHGAIKPAFGATFAQFVDLHLLCTRVPRTRSDAEMLFAPGERSGEVRYSWVVEVLLDELGGWEWDDGDGNKGKGKDESGGKEGEVRWTRRNREQRWGAVDVRSGVRLVDVSFQDMRPQGPVRLAAGFGGPPPRGL
ncbi:hypothetical protein F4806DRAFT_393654 [Annulohypoxylon nitens]|nr:hypothetical protein F4806DRAFT_393654 [Annulohypoxylon nitens]